MMSSKALGLNSALKRSILTPGFGKTRALVHKRGIQIESRPASSADGILNKQRLARPTSPHLTIYQYQLTMLSSGANRATGLALSILLYGYFLGYLVAPGTLDSAHVVEFLGGLPDALKYAGKTILAAPFAYHSLNGIRHLSWDTGRLLSLKASYRAGYTVLGATAIATVGLLFM